MSIFIGVNGNSKEVKGLYVGVNGTPKEVSTVYCGVNNSIKTVFEAKADPGQSTFVSSSIFTVPRGVNEVQIFCVGGGAGGGAPFDKYVTTYNAGHGGGGGYTITRKIGVCPGQQLSVSVGAGCTLKESLYSGNTIVNDIQANGGTGIGTFGSICEGRNNGGNGGSGGGQGGSFQSTYLDYQNGSNGGSDGSDGYSQGNSSIGSPFGGIGQGTTTRAFGESWGTLYAGGGGGGAYYKFDGSYNAGSGGNGGGGNGGLFNSSGQNGGTNTGGGGGGAGTYYDYSASRIIETSGGSGIAIIRWGY